MKKETSTGEINDHKQRNIKTWLHAWAESCSVQICR